MGKTHFAENTLVNVYQKLRLVPEKNLHVIQNDLVRMACLDRWMKDNPRMTKNEGVKATAQ